MEFQKLKSGMLRIFFFALVFISYNIHAQEDCSNGIDDDGDGLIDCLDPDCLADPACPAFAVPGSCLPIGYYPDITGTAGGYKQSPSTANVTIPIAPNSNRVSLIIQGVYQNAPVDAQTGVNDLNHAQERVIWGRVEMDLDNSISSGWVEYMVNNHESRRFSWVDQPMGPATTDTYTRVGHDMTELTDYEFSFDASPTDLSIGCTRAELDISYYAIYYGNFATQSMTRIEGQDPTQYPVYFDAGAAPANLTSTIDLLPAPDQPDYIQVRAIGINQNRIGNGGILVQDTREEALSIKYILIDVNTMTASGNMTINNGNIPDMCTTFSFENYDVTSGLPIVGNSTTLGDISGNITPPDQIALPDMTIQIVGDQLILTRSNEFGNDFNEIYYVEFLKYSNQPYSSSFFITENAYSGPLDIGYDTGGSNDGVSVDGFIDFTIPEGAKRGYLEIRANGLWSPSNLASYVGPAPSNTTRTNGNQMYTFTEVNFDLNETTGFFVTLTTSTQQQLYAWQSVPINPLIDITTTGIYGQLPNSDERINFEIIPPNTFRVHLSNDKIGYERTAQMTFLGSKVNLVYSTFTQNNAIFTGCDSVYFDMEVCNSGGSDLTQGVPVSFYNGDPTTDPTAIYLQTEMYNLNIDQGQCATFTFGIDIASLGGATAGDITIVLNDDGSFGGTPGTTILSTFTPLDLADQGNPVLECEYDQNIISAPWTLVPPPEPTITFNQNTFTICPTEDATIIATPNGTTGEFTYDWSPAPGSTNTITVSPNVETWYYLTVTDVCSSVLDSVKVEIGNVNITSIDVIPATNCPGVAGTPGQITVNPADPSWQYTVTGGPTVIGPQASNVFPGLDGGIWYFVNVVDANGCVTDTNIYVGLGANAVIANLVTDSLRPVSCYNAFDGGAYVDGISGGITPPYDVTWTHTSGPYATTTVPVNGADDIDNLMGGNWTVTVTDQEGCAWSELFTIFEPDDLTLDFTSNNPTCYQFNDGSITVNTTGGNGTNVITILDATGTQVNIPGPFSANNLTSGWYYAEIVDANTCFVEDSIFIDQPGELAVDLLLTDPLCHGFATGLAIVDTVYNYTGDYNAVSYFWKEDGQVEILIDEVNTYHQGIIKGLVNGNNDTLSTEIHQIFQDLKIHCQKAKSDDYNFEYDQIISIGEIVSTKIISHYLNQQGLNCNWMDARKLVRTDFKWREARIDWDKTTELIHDQISDEMWSNHNVAITQGFIGHTKEGQTTTLGREGSDFTAAIFAYVLECNDVTIWKDVAGMLNADPKYFENTILLKQISFREAIELAYFGASVIHPRTIQPLKRKNIPLHIKSFLDHKADGSIIQTSEEFDQNIPSFIFKMDQMLISLTPRDFSFVIEENLEEIFNYLSKESIRMNIMQNSAINFSFCVDKTKIDIEKFVAHFHDDYIVKYNENLELVTIRHYDDPTIERVTVNKEVLLEQKSRHTARMVMIDV